MSGTKVSTIRANTFHENESGNKFSSPANVTTMQSIDSPLTLPSFDANLIGSNKDAGHYVDPPSVVSYLDQLTPQPITGGIKNVPTTIPNRVDITPENYKEMALKEINRQSLEVFNGQGVPNGKQVAIVDAYRRLAGLPPIISDDVARRTKKTAEEISISNIGRKSIESLGAAATNVAKTTGKIAENVSNPFSLIALAAIAGLGAFFVLRR